MQLGCVYRGAKARALLAATLSALIAVLAVSLTGGEPPALASATPPSQGTVWLCHPGQVNDPCDFPLQSTVVPARGARTTSTAAIATNSKFDCFYVYPTVSTEPTANSDLTVQRSEIDVAAAQASRFSQVCHVWAPMYRQRTDLSILQGLGAGQSATAVAYASLLSAFKDYMAHDNRGRPIVFIGHSQGAAMLIRLLASQVDPDPSLRRRVVVAILAGGNVTVPEGKTVGASFRHLPLCTTAEQTGCVIAYSTFPSQPPADAVFGRPGQGVSLQSGQTATEGVQVACVNPAAIGGGTGSLYPDFITATAPPGPPAVTTPWVSYPGLYSAVCKHAGGATWLQVNTLTVAGRPVVSEKLGPAWGYHLDDINLALGNLVNDVRAEEAAYSSHQ